MILALLISMPVIGQPGRTPRIKPAKWVMAAGALDRAQWVKALYKIAYPVVHNLAAGTLKKNLPLEQGPELYKTFRDKQDGCIKVVLKPGMTADQSQA